MTFKLAEILQKCLLGLTLLIAIGAFFPDNTHLSMETDETAAVESTHDDIAADDLDTKPCHNSVSCSGAIATRDQATPTTLILLVSQTYVERKVVDDSPLLWRDPPVPIETA